VAAGLGSGSLTDPAALHPVYRNTMLICAALMLGGAALAAIFVPTRLPAHTPPPTPSPASPSSPSPSSPSPSSAAAADSVPAVAQHRTFCDPAGPPVHPRSSL